MKSSKAARISLPLSKALCQKSTAFTNAPVIDLPGKKIH